MATKTNDIIYSLTKENERLRRQIPLFKYVYALLVALSLFAFFLAMLIGCTVK